METGTLLGLGGVHRVRLRISDSEGGPHVESRRTVVDWNRPFVIGDGRMGRVGSDRDVLILVLKYRFTSRDLDLHDDHGQDPRRKIYPRRRDRSPLSCDPEPPQL